MIKRLKKEQKINYQEIDHFSPLVRRLTAPNPSPFTLHGTGTFIIGNKEICIIDPGPKLDTHIDNILNSINRKLITHILITHTHKDHSPAAQELKKATNAKTYGFGPYPINNYVDKYEEGHDLDFKPDIFLKDGDIIISIKNTDARWRTLLASVNSISPGEVLDLRIIRDGNEIDLKVVTKERPNLPPAL